MPFKVLNVTLAMMPIIEMNHYESENKTKKFRKKNNCLLNGVYNDLFNKLLNKLAQINFVKSIQRSKLNNRIGLEKTVSKAPNWK